MSNSQIKIEVFDWLQIEHQARFIRGLVFMQEQHISADDEWDANDQTASHFLLSNHQQAIGYARLIIDQTPDTEPRCHIGRVAVLKPFRQHGYGKALMEYLVNYCQYHFPPAEIYLHAQVDKIGFYQRLGFVSRGNRFLDAGIAHQEMIFK